MVDAIQPFHYDVSTGRMTAAAFPADLTQPAPPQSNALMAGLRSGGDLFVKNLGGAAAALGQTVGSQGIQDFGVDLAQRYGQYATQAQRPDLEGSYGPTGLLYKGAQMLPSLGAMLAGAVGGGLVGGPAGAVAGGAAFSAPETAGGFMNTAMEQPGGAAPGEGARALALGLPLGASMATLPPGIGPALEKLAVKSVGERALKGGMIFGGVQGVQSGVTTALDQTFRDDPGTFTDRAGEIVKSAIGGFVMGGLTGAGIGAITGRSPNEQLAKSVDDAVGRAEPDAAAASAEQAGGVAASAPPALAGPDTPLALPGQSQRLALPAPNGAVRTLADHTDEQLQMFHDDLSSKTDRTPAEDQLKAKLEAEFTRRQNTPDAAEAAYQDAVASGDPDRIAEAQRSLARTDPNQQPMDLGGTPVGEQPVSRAVRQQQEAVAAQQQAFVDQVKTANDGKPTQLSKFLEKNPVNTPEEFATTVYDNFNPKIPSLRKLADNLGLLDEKGKLFTQDTLEAAHKDAVYKNLLNPTTESTAEVTKLETTKQLLDTIEQTRKASSEVPAFEPSQAMGGDLDVAPQIPVREPGLPLGVPQPLPLDGFANPLEMIRGLTNNERAQSSTKMGTPEGEIARMMNTKDLADLNAKTLEPLGLVKDGKRVSFDEAIADAQAKAADAQSKNDPVARGQAQAQIDQLQKIKAVDDLNAAQDANAQKITTKPLQREFQKLEQVRRQLPPEMPNALERVQDMQTRLIAADTQGKTALAGQAAQLADAVKARLGAKNGLGGDLTPLKAPEPAGAPSQAAVARGQRVQAAPKPKATQRAAQPIVEGQPATLPQGVKPNLARLDNPELRTPMDNDVEHLVSAGAGGKELTAHFAENSTDPFRRQLADRLSKLGVDPKIEFGSPEGHTFEGQLASAPDAKVTGSYDRTSNTIHVYDRSTLEDTVMHEMVHAATAKAIDARGQTARKMEQLFNKISETDITNPGTGKRWYGMENMHEFVAEAFTNPRFQAFLKTRPAETGSTLGNMWQAFKNTVFKALGLDDRMRTAFDQAIEGGNKLMDEAAVSRDGVGTVPDAERQTSAMMDELPRVQETIDRVADMAHEAAVSGRKVNSRLIETAKRWANDIAPSGAIARRMRDKPMQAAAMEFMDSKHSRKTIFNQFSALSTTARESWAKLKPEVRTVLANITEMDALGVNVERNWAQHTWLHDTPERKADVDAGNELFRKLKQMGGDEAVQAYNDMKMTNRAMWLGEQIKTLEKLGRPFAKGLELNGFDTTMAERFQMRDDLHTNLQAAHDFIDGEFKAKMTEFRRALGGKAEEISGLQSQGKNSQAANIFKKYSGLMDWVKKIDESVQRADQVPNFHKGRYGDYMVSGHFDVVNGKLDARAVSQLKARLDKATGGSTVFHASGDNPSILMMFEDKATAEDVHSIMKQAQADGLLSKDKAVKTGAVSNDSAIQGVIPQHVMDLWEQIQSSELYRGHDPASVAAQEEAKRRFMSAWLDLVPDNAVSHVLQKRTFSHGSSSDVLRSFVHRNQILSHSIASGSLESRINQAVGQMRNRIEDMKGTSKPNEIYDAQRDFNSLVQYENELPKRVDDKFINMMRSWNHAYFLGFSPSYVLMNMIQPVQNALPELGKSFGYGASAKVMAQTLPDVTKIMAAVLRAPTRVDMTITRDILKTAGVDARTIDTVMRGINDGTIDGSGPTRDLAAVAKGTDQHWHDKVVRVANTMPMASETASRLVALLAADRLYDANPEKARFPGSKFKADMTPAERDAQKAAFTRFFVNETMGRYGAGELPRVLTNKGPLGPLSPLAGSFMSYYLGMFEKMTHEIGGAFDRSLSKEDRAASRQYLSGHMTTMAVLAGTMGLPFFNAISGLATQGLNLVTGRDDWDVASSYRSFLSDIFSPTVSDVIARGVPRALGFDLSHLGEQDMLPFTQLLTDRRKMEEKMSDYAQSLVGAPGAMLAGVGEGIRDMVQGRPLEGMIKAAPVALRNPLKAYALQTRGYLNSSGIAENIDSGPADVIAQFMGIKMAEPANLAEATHSMMQLNASRQARSQSLTKNLLAAYERGDAAEQAAAAADVKTFDEQHPNTPIMRKLAGTLTHRQMQSAQAAELGTPIGMSPLDLGGRHLLRYLNH